MSTYKQETKNPLTGKWEVATWEDDKLGRHHYGVIFPDGSLIDPEFIKLETRAITPFITKDSGVRKKWASGMQRDTQDDKPRFDLIWQPMLKRWAELMARGAVKYEENNWMLANSKEELTRFKASAYRHLFQWFNGESPEEDHASAVFFNIMCAEYLKEKLNETKKD